MNPGELRHRITIQAPTGTTVNAANEDMPIYEDWKPVWANVKPLRGKEYLEAKKIRVEMMYKVIIRYMQGVTDEMQVILKDGRILGIQNAINLDEKNTEIHLMCIEKVK